MARAKIKSTAFDDVARLLDDPPPPRESLKKKTWEPSLNPIQKQAFMCETRNLLLWGPKGSGKSVVGTNLVMKHCYENRNALAFILTPVRSMSEDGGAWHKLVTTTAPQWEEGLGIQVKPFRDKQHNECLWVQNMHGEWSQIKGISAPHAEQLRDRFPGREPSMVFVDELTRCSTVEYFRAPSAQLGRRPGVEGVQQFVAACNPEGPSHWVYKTWFVEPFDEEKGVWSPNFENIYLPFSDNAKNLPPDYEQHVKDTYAGDAVEYSRLVAGEWIDRASGESLFREIYNPQIHVQPQDQNGNPDPSNWLEPVKGHPMIIGADPGSVHNAFAFLQWLPLDGRMKWVAFDEIVSIRKRIAYEDFIPIVMRRVKFWRDAIGATAQELPQVWNSDSSAFNQFRAAQGSFDVMEIEKIYEAMRGKYGLEPIKVKSAPKFNGSVIIRVRTLQKLIASDDFIVSSRCQKIQAMLLQLESQKQKPGAPFDPDLSMTPRRSEHLHVFDSVTYPILTASVTPTLLLPTSQSTQSLMSMGH